MSDTKKDYGPIWQIEQQIKYYDGIVSTCRADSQRSLIRSEEAEVESARYKQALEILQAHLLSGE